MTQICLIRHGQTDWNVEGRYQGQSDVDLNAPGVGQAQSLAQQLACERFDAFFSSDLTRAKRTAQIVAAPHGLQVSLDTRLREIHQGEWEGELVRTIQKRYEHLWQGLPVPPQGIRPPGGESVEEVATRMLAALDEIATKYAQGRVAVVSHGLSIATVICKKNDIPIGQAYRYIPNNAAPTWIEWQTKG